ncbi:MAG: integrase core domain-containing protein [Thermoplasmatales archaeon]
MHEDSANLESFHNSFRTDCIWINDLETFEDAKHLMEHTFNNYNYVRPHSYIHYLITAEFEIIWDESDEFLEIRKGKGKKRIKNREEGKGG